MKSMVVVAQLAERRIVIPGVAGSSPVYHPKCTANFKHLGSGSSIRRT